MGEKRKKVYTLRLWDNPPSDRESEWTDDMRQGILDRFEIY